VLSTFKVRYLLHFHFVRFQGRVSFFGVLSVMLYYTMLLSVLVQLEEESFTGGR
jgi:hypothetical protein